MGLTVLYIAVANSKTSGILVGVGLLLAFLELVVTRAVHGG